MRLPSLSRARFARAAAPVLLPCLLAACASHGNARGPERLPFTDGLAANYGLVEDQKQDLQYYLSDRIELVRTAESGQVGVRDGILVDHSYSDSDRVVVEPGTPGVVLASGPNWMAVSFAKGRYFYFVSDPPRSAWRGGDWAPGRYYLYQPGPVNGLPGPVQFDNALYYATGNSYQAFLVVDRESFARATGREERLPGRRLKED